MTAACGLFLLQSRQEFLKQYSARTADYASVVGPVSHQDLYKVSRYCSHIARILPVKVLAETVGLRY